MTISIWTLLVLLGLSGSFGVVFGCVVASKPAWAEEIGAGKSAARSDRPSGSALASREDDRLSMCGGSRGDRPRISGALFVSHRALT